MKQALIKHFCYKIWYSLSIFIEKANIFVPIAHRNQQKALWISVDFRGYRMKYWIGLTWVQKLLNNLLLLLFIIDMKDIYINVLIVGKFE